MQDRGLRPWMKTLAVLGTGLFGAAIGYWNSVSPYFVRHASDAYDGYFDGIMMIFGGLIGLTLAAYATAAHRSKIAWIVSLVVTALVALIIPFGFNRSTENHSREAVGYLCSLVFVGIHAGWAYSERRQMPYVRTHD